jgi:diguanylate cyclase (GGDEF)-like protein
MLRFPHIGLLGRFAIASAICVSALGVAMMVYLRAEAEQRAIADAKETAELVTQLGRDLQIVGGQQTRFDDVRFEAFRGVLARNAHITGFVIWNGRGGTFYASDTRLFDDERPGEGPLAAALADRRLGHRRPNGKTLRVYAPLSGRRGEGDPSVVQLDFDYAPIAAAVRHERVEVAVMLGVGLLALWAALFRIAWGSSRRLREQVAENEHLANHDPLTGLPNRSLFRAAAARALVDARRDGTQVAVVLLDLDRFKEVNDTLGHQYGDRLLEVLARRVHGTLRAEDVVARIGGDEFALLLTGLRDEGPARRTAARIREALVDPFLLDGLPLVAETSIGIAFYPADGDDVDALIQRADVALYAAKASGSGIEIYDADRDGSSRDRLRLVADLRSALQRAELVLHYQPTFELRTGALRGVEALVRWQHPERGLVPPDAFIPLAQQTGLVGPLTDYVLQAAIAQCRAWLDAGFEIQVAVNVSPRNLADVQFPDRVAAFLEVSDVPGRLLRVEITESAAMDDPLRARAALQRIAALGVGISIDDFGTGHSSLAFLRRLPIDEVKIDRSFVGAMLDEEADLSIVRATIELGRNLGMGIVAEGVETEEIRALLTSLGCEAAQGWLWGKPVPAAELADVIAAGTSVARAA